VEESTELPGHNPTLPTIISSMHATSDKRSLESMEICPHSPIIPGAHRPDCRNGRESFRSPVRAKRRRSALRQAGCQRYRTVTNCRAVPRRISRCKLWSLGCGGVDRIGREQPVAQHFEEIAAAILQAVALAGDLVGVDDVHVGPVLRNVSPAAIWRTPSPFARDFPVVPHAIAARKVPILGKDTALDPILARLAASELVRTLSVPAGSADSGGSRHFPTAQDADGPSDFGHSAR
jgi:hypothetical protein